MLLKAHKKAVVLIIIALVFSGAAILGYVLAENEPRIAGRAAADASSVVEAQAGDAKISPEAVVEWDYEYTMCGHHVYATSRVDAEMAGLTFTELQEKFPQITIVSFDTDKLVLKKAFECYCPDHYLLKQYDGELAIFRTRAGTDEQYVYMQIPIDFASIDKEEQQVLTVGKIFGSIEDLEHYIENIET